MGNFTKNPPSVSNQKIETEEIDSGNLSSKGIDIRLWSEVE